MNRIQPEQLVQKIRSQYTQSTSSELDALRSLDRKVKRPARVFAWSFGTLSALVMGSGMSLIMTDIAGILGLTQAMLPGLALGIAGMILALLNYPIYKRILDRRKRKYAQKIISMSDAVLKP